MPAEIPQGQKEELAVTYAALILHDEGLPITVDKLNAILGAASVKVQPFWPSLFARVLANRNIDDFILNAGGGGAAPAPAAAPAGGAAAATEEKKEEKKEEKEEAKEEEDEDMGFGLFD